MLKVALKDILARKRRLVTTSIAIVLGIAFLTGTNLLSNTLRGSIEDLISDVYDGIDVVVRSPDLQETPFGQPIRAAVPASLVDEVAAVDGVRIAEGFVESTGPQLVGDDNKVYGGGFGPPTLVYNWVEDDGLRTGRLTEGRGPEADDEIAIDFSSAEDLGKSVGDQVQIATLQGEGTQSFELVGILGLGKEGDKASGAKPLFFTTATAMALVDQPGEFNFVAVAAEDGVTQAELADNIVFALPAQQVVTGAAFTEESQEQISAFVDILGTFVSVFGYIALFVAIFIIYNTFSIIITQRTRETALLRAVGARRRQVLGAIMLEAVIVGLVAAFIGLLAGTALAAILISLVGNFFTVGSAIPALSAGTVISAVLIGVVVTVLSAFIPALRSSKIPPIAAMSEAAHDTSDLSLARKIWGAFLLLGGVILIGLGLADVGPNPLVFVGVGAGAVLLSVAVILGPLIAAPVSRLLSKPFAWRSDLAGRLAGENAARNPKRTASTAAALTIGVTLVVVIAIVAASFKATFDSTVSDSVNADYVVATASVTSFGAIPPGLVDEVRSLPDVAAASPVRFGFVRLLDDAAKEQAAGTTDTIPEGLVGATDAAPDGQDEFILGVDPESWFDVIDNGELQGDLADLGENTMAVNADYAQERGWRLGDRIPVYFGQTGEQELEVAVTFDRDIGQGDIYLPLATFEPNMLPLFNSDAQIYVLADDGADTAALGDQLDALVAEQPTVVIQNLQEFIEAQTGPFNVVLSVVYALLALAVLIALIGIANTLSLSVLERTRELGLLRAVGMSRKQLGRMVRTEAAIIAVFGTLIGLVIGIAFAIALTTAISSDAPDAFTFVLPLAQLAVITVVAAFAGVTAALLPARRAARLDVLEAISSV